HTCALASDSTTYCWGNTNGPTPVAVSAGLIFRAVVAGGDETTAPAHTCGLTSDGAAYCWGNDGNLGNDSIFSSSTPVAVSGGLSFIALAAGGAHTCGLTPGGKAYCWGRNASGQLGIGTAGPETCGSAPCSTVPVPVATSLRWASVTGGVGRTCGLTPGG